MELTIIDKAYDMGWMKPSPPANRTEKRRARLSPPTAVRESKVSAPSSQVGMVRQKKPMISDFSINESNVWMFFVSIFCGLTE